MNLSKKIGNCLAKLVFTTAVAGLVYGRADIELARSIGIMPDKYKNKKLEQVVEEVKTWNHAKNYILNHLSYKLDARVDGTINNDPPLIQTHALGNEDCDGGATAGAALLSDDNRYKCYKMKLNSKKEILGDSLNIPHHIVALVYDKESKKYGSLGIHKIDCLPPSFDTSDGVFNWINVASGLIFNEYALSEYDKSLLVNGKHFVDAEIEFNKNFNNCEIGFALDVKSSEDNDRKRYMFFTSPPEKYFTYDDWFKAAKNMPLYNSTELESVFNAYADSIINTSVDTTELKKSAGLHYLDRESFTYPYASTTKSFSEFKLEDLMKLNN